MLANPKFDVSGALHTVNSERLMRSVAGEIPPPCTLDNKQWPPDYEKVHAWRAQKLSMFEMDPPLAAEARLAYSTHPVEFINHWCDTYDPRNAGSGKPVNLPLILFKRQEELVKFVLACVATDTGGIVEKSRDMGATWVCAALSVWMWLYWPAVAVGWGSNKQEKVDRRGDPDSVLEKIRMLIRGLPEALRPTGVLGRHPSGGDYLKQYVLFNPGNSATIRGEIGANIGRGGRTRCYFVDEAAHLDRPEAVVASLSENTRSRIDISSVSGLGTIFHRAREAGEEWEVGRTPSKMVPNVFVMDWSHHPEKTQAWYDQRQSHFASQGLRHVFAREIERNYAASVEGRIIPYEWLESCVDAHLKLGFDDSGMWVAGLDVADGGLDNNAFVARKGSVIKRAAEWGERDVGASARRAVILCEDILPLQLQYDCIGVGAGIKSETNRLKDDGLLPAGLELVPWNAGAKVLDPHGRVVAEIRDGESGIDDENSPKNKDFYANFKAQGWWQARMRVYRTHQAITEGLKFAPDQMISFDSDSIGPLLLKLMKELAQASVDPSSNDLKLRVDKTPEGTKSPNLADGAIMALWPWHGPERPSVSYFVPQIIQG